MTVPKPSDSRAMPVTPSGTSAGPAFTLPAFSDPFGRMLIACGDLERKGAGAEAMAKTKSKEGKIAVSAAGGFVDVWGAPHLESDHLHIVAVGPLWPGKKPKATTKEADVLSFLSTFLAEKITVAGTGRFEVKVDQLPPTGLVGTALSKMRVTVGEVTLQQTGARFTVTGGSTREVQWSYDPDDGFVRVEIEVQITTVITPDYLVLLYNETLDAFHRWIMGPTNATPR